MRERCCKLLLILSVLGLTALVSHTQPLTLPPGQISGTTTPAVSVANTQQASTFIVTFSSVPPGYSIGNQSYLAWCPDAYGDYNSAPTQPYTLYSTYDTEYTRKRP